MKVVIADIASEAAKNTADKIIASGGDAVAVATDVSDEKSTIEMAAKAFERFGRIDVLVNNAALFTSIEHKLWDQVTVNEWDGVMAVNIRGIWLCSKAVFPYMKTQGKGKIINVLSGIIFKGGKSSGLIHYITSKGGVMAFTRALAREVAEYNINVNSIAPGFTESEKAIDIVSTELRSSQISGRCIKRAETPEDLTGTLVFLASDDSDFVDGQLIVVDGGEVFH